MSKFGNVKEVVRNTTHYLTYLSVVVISVGKSLKMGVCVGTHIRLNLGTHNVSRIGHIEIGQALDNS